LSERLTNAVKALSEGVLNKGEPSSVALQNYRGMILVVLGMVSAIVYSYHLGGKALGPSEAYSAFAATQPTAGTVARNALEFDPGKPVIYHLLLHWFCRWFTSSETALRTFSLIFGAASAVLTFAYGAELFGVQVGVAAAAMWAFNPLAVLFARWARMYSMFVALALAHLLAMAKLRNRPTRAMTIVAGLLGAAMLYTHLAAVFIVAADLMVTVRELRRERRSVSLPAIMIAVLLFAPFFPLAAAQSKALLFGHWLDWLGVHHESIAVRLLAGGAAVWVLLWLSFGVPQQSDESELLLRCCLFSLVPAFALTVGSIVIRPMFSIRYAAPSYPVMTIIIARLADRRGARFRNDLAVAITVLLVLLLPLSYQALDQPWREIAKRVTAPGHENETIFFETGFFSPELAVDEQADNGFPQGFFRVPFRYYFRQSNPNASVPGGSPLRARQLIEKSVLRTGGAWLISGKKPRDAMIELPWGAPWQMDFCQSFGRVLVFHVKLRQRTTDSRQTIEADRLPSDSCRNLLVGSYSN
jgi:hypothetical protein